MGLFSKVWKGVKSAVKKVGGAIKKVVSPIAKVADKFGIVGQIGLMFVLPGLGGLITKGFGALAGGLSAAANPVLSTLGKVLTTAGKFAKTVGNAFKTVTSGVGSFIKDIGGSFINKAANAVGFEGKLISSAPKTIGEGFNKWTQGVYEDAANITSPFKQASAEVAEEVALASEDIYEETLASSGPTEDMSMDIRDKVELPDYTKVTPVSASVNDPEAFKAMMEAERQGIGSYLKNVTDYAAQTVKALPEKAIDSAAQTVTSLPGEAIREEAGLGPKAPQVTQVTNVTPSFDFAPITNQYEAQGFSYGATPQNRVSYMAAQEIPFGDFGLGAYKKFYSTGMAA